MRFRGSKISHIIAFTFEQAKEKEREFVYKCYVTDGLKAITENTARFAGGSELRKSWCDVVNGMTRPEETAEETTIKVLDKIGLTVKGLNA